MQRLLLLFGVSLVFSLGLLTQAQTQQYELVPNWAKLPEGWVFGHPQEFSENLFGLAQRREQVFSYVGTFLK